MFFDPIYLLFLLPGLGLALWARWRIASARVEVRGLPAGPGVSGAEAAALVLGSARVAGDRVEPVERELADHYDPASRVVRLSPEVYHGRSLAALGVAAHEAAHAAQHARGDPRLLLRDWAVPAAGYGCTVFWLFIVAGLLFHMFELVLAGTAVLSANVLLQALNLPLEFDASRRARGTLLDEKLVGPEEDAAVTKVLEGAAFTYLAAALTGTRGQFTSLLPRRTLRRRGEAD